MKEDWSALKQRVMTAIAGDNLAEMDDLANRSALRSFPACAKPIVDIALNYPEELDQADFRRAFVLAGGAPSVARSVGAAIQPPKNGYSSDAGFNPGENFVKYYKGRQSAIGEERQRERREASSARRPPAGPSPVDGGKPTPSDIIVPVPKMSEYEAEKFRLDFDFEVTAALERASALQAALAEYMKQRPGDELAQAVGRP